MDIVVNNPKPGDPSYDLFIKEKSETLKVLAEKAQLTAEMFNKVHSVSCCYYLICLKWQILLDSWNYLQYCSRCYVFIPTHPSF